MYGKNGMLEEAEVVFDGLLTKDVVTWTSLICGYVGSGHGEKAIQFLFKMSEEGITPNSVTFICGLKACRLLGDIDKCRQIHTDLVKGGYEVDIRILSSLIGMYTSCNQFEETQVVFDKAFVKDVVLWTALIGGYAETGNSKEALTWLERMQIEGFLPNPATFVCGLKACCNLGSSEEVQRLHINLIKSGFEGDSLLITSLMNAYSKCGFLSEAQHIFDEVEIKSLPIWNTLIGGYIDHECGQEALDNFRRMQVERVSPDSITLVYALKACIISKLMQNGQCLQIETTKFGFDRDYFVGIQLLDMYSKFGLVEEAQHVFERLPTWDVVSYNALIMGFAEHGFGEEALQCLSRMHEEGVSMDAITAVCGLKACISSGLIRIGRWIHGQILKQDLIEQDPIIGILLIDIYVKCKYLLEAQKVFYGMTNKSLIAWSTLLMGYAFSGEWELVFSLLGEMQSCGMPLDTICLLSALTVCSHSGLIEEGVRVFGILGKEYAIPSNLEHFNSMIDLFCRAGQIEKASGMLDVIPFQPNFVTWTTLLGACRQCGDIQVAKQAFNHAAVLTGNKVDLLISTLGVYEDNCWFLRQAVGSESSAEVGIVRARAVCH
ncbi:hypothetical protein KP509_39G004000 [Ceratopteris richardii]|nr:hypothetical protein KP509_39G004000 [Ceratopteris richardii]